MGRAVASLNLKTVLGPSRTVPSQSDEHVPTDVYAGLDFDALHAEVRELRATRDAVGTDGVATRRAGAPTNIVRR